MPGPWEPGAQRRRRPRPCEAENTSATGRAVQGAAVLHRRSSESVTRPRGVARQDSRRSMRRAGVRQADRRDGRGASPSDPSALPRLAREIDRSMVHHGPRCRLHHRRHNGSALRPRYVVECGKGSGVQKAVERGRPSKGVGSRLRGVGTVHHIFPPRMTSVPVSQVRPRSSLARFGPTTPKRSPGLPVALCWVDRPSC